MRSLAILVVVLMLGCDNRTPTHEVAAGVPRAPVVQPGQIATVLVADAPCGVVIELEFLNERLVLIRAKNRNTIPVKVVLVNTRMGMGSTVQICVPKKDEDSEGAGAAGAFGEIGDTLVGEISLQSVPLAHYLCLAGSFDGFDVCSNLIIHLTP